LVHYKLKFKVFITQDGSQLKVIIKEQTRNVRALHGLYRTLINNMVVGVSEQFDLTLTLKVLDIELRFKVKKLF
jgi:large subunit ribosomal protein L6